MEYKLIFLKVVTFCLIGSSALYSGGESPSNTERLFLGMDWKQRDTFWCYASNTALLGMGISFVGGSYNLFLPCKQVSNPSLTEQYENLCRSTIRLNNSMKWVSRSSKCLGAYAVLVIGTFLDAFYELKSKEVIEKEVVEKGRSLCDDVKKIKEEGKAEGLQEVLEKFKNIPDSDTLARFIKREVSRIKQEEEEYRVELQRKERFRKREKIVEKFSQIIP